MSGNSFGLLYCVTSFGESHGPAIGCVVDGCPPGLELSEADIQPDLDLRKPGTSRHVTQWREEDAVEILSGVFEGRTTGTPIALLIRNTDQPGVIGDIGTILGKHRVNIANFALGRQGDSAVGVVDPARLNVHGGSLALGHPFAATGARMVTTMANELHATGKRTARSGASIGTTTTSPPRAGSQRTRRSARASPSSAPHTFKRAGPRKNTRCRSVATKSARCSAVPSPESRRMKRSKAAG